MDSPQTPAEHPNPLHWTDSRGQQWVLEPSREALTLTGPDDHACLLREEWDSKVAYNDAGARIVFRFDVGDTQIGFMVSREEATALLRQLDWTNERAQESAERLRTHTSRSHSWSTVTAWSIWGLFAAALAFLPVIGLAFAILAVVCIVVARRKARNDTRLVHTSTLVAATAVIAGIATTAHVLSLITFAKAAVTAAHTSGGAMQQELTVANKVIAVIVVLLSLSVHEAAHAVAAWWCGDEGPRQRGRVTLNPLAHIDPIGTILVPAFLAYYGNVVFGWARPVMVSLHGVPNPRRANLLISAAGPFSNVLLGLIFLSLYLILGCCIRLCAPDAAVVGFAEHIGNVTIEGFTGANYLAMVTVCLKWGFLINLLLFFFNMIPLPPLDGGHIAGSLFPSTVGEFYRKLGRFSMIILLALFMTGSIGIILAPGLQVIDTGFAWVSLVTGL
jgi:Zn-dependent protease